MPRKTEPISPRPMVMRLRPADTESAALGFDLHGHLNQADSQGVRRFAGLMTLPDGRHVASFSMTIPAALFEVRRKTRPRGRPTNEAANFATFLHEEIAQYLKDISDISLASFRAGAMERLAKGNRDATNAHNIRQWRRALDAANKVASVWGVSFTVVDPRQDGEEPLPWHSSVARVQSATGISFALVVKHGYALGETAQHGADMCALKLNSAPVSTVIPPNSSKG